MDDGPLFARLKRPAASPADAGAHPASGSTHDAPRDPLAVEVRPAGLYLPRVDLYLDPHAPVPRAFISHAHADHSAVLLRPSEETLPAELRLASATTAALLRARYGERAADVTPLAWSTPIPLASSRGDARVTVVPAGHILGAAALVLECDGGVLVYTGDVRPAPGLTHPAAALPRCDVLVIESTFGLPIFAFPPDAECHARCVEFARATLAAGDTPVFLAYALGKGQELAQLLGAAGVPVRAHGSMTALNEAYRALGVELPNVRPYARDDEGPPGALIVPPRERFGAMFRSAGAAAAKKKGKPSKRAGGAVRVAYVSGWALFDASRERFDADLQVPLSDHASFRELDAIVEGCAPRRRVYVTHGYAAAYARHLRRKGYDAAPLDAAGYEA